MAGVKDTNHKVLHANQDVECVHFDFSDVESIKRAFDKCDIVFLLRPPQIADVEKYFKPLIQIAIDKGVRHIVFLSVQGVETSSMIPHHKIEKLITDSGINFTFLRPAYFMQNFTTTLQKELVAKSRIYLPAGKTKFTLIDTRDIGAVAANILLNAEHHINKAYDLTNDELLNFYEMAEILSRELGRKIEFVSPGLLSFFISKLQAKMPVQFILVMIMLHYLPRFKPSPKTSDWVARISGNAPGTFLNFVQANKDVLTPA